MAILNKGTLLAEAPISELLKGPGASVFCITVKGDYQGLCDRIVALPWVTGVNVVNGARAMSLKRTYSSSFF
ncbi:MAG: hypothetical protein NTY03_11220 [Candidatus Bathyarchaeota archaeon]|nr:hypothetical protein [Candidatus Bathyarchaeota archaeon]